MNLLRSKQKRNNIRFKLVSGFAVVIFTATFLMAGAFYLIVNQLQIDNATGMLDTAMQTAWAQFNARPVQLQGILQEVSRSPSLPSALLAEDKQTLQQVIQNGQVSYRFVDFWVITNSEGRVLCRPSGAPVGETWYLSYLVKAARETRGTLTSTELVPAEALSRENPDLAHKAEILLEQQDGQGGRKVFSDGLVTVIIAPVLGSEGEFLGTITGGILLNHDDWLPTQYTNLVPRTYLSIGVEGVRIASNIETRELSRPLGSIQEKLLVETTSQGKQYRGRLVVNNKQSLLAVDPIRNYAGEVVGNIGVGAPINMFSYKANGLKAILFVAALVFAVTMFMAEKVGNMIVNPIYRLKSIARQMADNTLDPEEAAWGDTRDPVEIQELAETIISGARAVKQKEHEAQTYAQDLANEKAQLEVNIQRRTQELAQTVAELQMTNRYKSQFLANMSHELRTPLNAVIGFAQLLEEHVAGDLNAKQQRYAYNILVSANHLLELINDILDLVKIEQGKENFAPELVPVQDTVDGIMLLLAHQAKDKRLTLTAEVESGLPDPLWDKRKVKQILSNLVSNAIKFTPEGGEVELTAQKEGENILFRVRDTGIGIKPEDHERVFLAFEQAESSYTREFNGAGLGLAISKKLVELHNGKIWLDSALGEGTTVHVLLPIAPFSALNGRGE